MTSALNPGRPFTGTERQLLEDTLDLNRAELVNTVSGLTDAQARTRLVPSLTTPLTLLKHCAAAERIWFQRTLAGRPADLCGGVAVGGDPSFHADARETLADVITEYQTACDHSRRTAATYSLDAVAHHLIVGAVNLRFIYSGMIAETARHAGHADILVEQIRARAR